MVRSIFCANHRCSRNSQSLCGKLDLTLWCPIRATHRPRKEFLIKPSLRDVQAIEDQRDKNYRTPPTIRRNGGAVKQDTFAASFQGCRWASKRPGPLYSTVYVGVLICSSWEHSSYTSESGIWPWIEIVMWFEIWNTIGETNTYQWFVMNMKNCLRKTYKIVRSRLHLATDRMKTHYDIRANSTGFSAGDHV